MPGSCKNCLLPEAYPLSHISSQGVCQFCRAAPQESARRAQEEEESRKAYLLDFQTTIENVKKKNHRYDCMVCLSGGKDSLYLLYLLVKEYKLRVLAYTTDVNIPDIAWDNIRTTIERLNVDHYVYRPNHDFYKKLFRYVLQNQEERGAVYSVSYVYAPLFESDALRIATEKEIPLVFAAYSPGQPEKERMVYEFDRTLINDVDWTPPQLLNAGIFDQSDLQRFWNPRTYRAGVTFPRYIAPFHALDYDQDFVMKKVYDLGLVRKPRFASPILSNYPINWLLMYSDLKHFGYNPYAPEFASLIRQGKANRAYWKILGPVVDMMIKHMVFLGYESRRSLAWLELREEDLKITLPKFAYDPPYIAKKGAAS